MGEIGSTRIKRLQLIPLLRATLAVPALVAATWLLGQLTIDAGVNALTAGARTDQAVAGVVLAVGTLASATLTVGTALLAVAATGRSLGRTWTYADRAAHALTPRIWRRAVAAGLGASLIGAGPALAVDSPPDLGWQVTTEPAQEPAPTDERAHSLTGTQGASPDRRGSQSATAADGATRADPVTSPTNVVVKPGDCLWTIAERHLPDGVDTIEISAAWRAWYDANRDVIGPDPDLILPGQQLVAPQARP